MNADISFYIQPGADFFVRLQDVEKSLSPGDRVFHKYQRLMSDLARCFPHESATESFDEGRLIEIDEDNHNGGKENEQEGSDMPEFEKYNLTRDYTPANKADTIPVDEMVASLEDGHPMRPGTEFRHRISAFEANSKDTSEEHS